MTVFIAGATGVLGRRLVRQFSDNGRSVVGLARDPAGDEVVESHGGTPRRADLFDPESLARAADGAAVVIHAATAIPTKTRPTRADWATNDRIRREGTRALAAAAGAVGAEQYVQQSVTLVARQPDGSAFDEDSVPHPDRLTQSALDGEYIARRAGDRHGFEVSVLRCGTFYAPDAAHTRSIGENLQKGRLPIPGAGLLGRQDAVVSPLHADDAASAFLAAVEAGGGGRWHVVDDHPVTYAALLRAFADRLGAPAPRRVPAWLLVPVLGRDTVRGFTRSAPTSNGRFRDATGWAPAYPSYREGIDQVVSTWESTGFPWH